ncbi:MAG: NAD(P)-binding domain-containing protein [Bauldia sp.]|nr:NAD(P)-binding domain-containing protein [Bauldia sp.]
MSDLPRPFPPGDYPVVVVGSGPGGLQVSYSLRQLGVPHAVISADPSPGGMFRRWPLFQRLLSWTKPYAADGAGSPRYERTDWNSLLADEPEARALQATHMDGASYFPSRPEMEANLVDFAARAGIEVRYGCAWESTARIDDGSEMRFALTTSDGVYRCRVAIFAVGVAEPWNPAIPGIELAHHYADVRPPPSYAGKRLFIIGKRNSGFELASGLLQWAKSIALASPTPARLSVVTKSLMGVRARYAQPFEDNALGGGCVILDAAIDRIVAEGSALRVHLRRSSDGSALSVEADDVINATGFITPLRDLPALGVATFGQSRLPAQTAWWESATIPGIHFAGTITQGAPSLSKNGIPPNSGAVHGNRYNSRILARRIAETAFGVAPLATPVSCDGLVPALMREADQSADLWHQRGYLARVMTASTDHGIADRGMMPLTAFLDEATDTDGVALTIESDGTGAIYPVLYVRRHGNIAEHRLPDNEMADFTTAEHRKAMAAAVADLGT